MAFKTNGIFIIAYLARKNVKHTIALALILLASCSQPGQITRTEALTDIAKSEVLTRIESPATAEFVKEGEQVLNLVDGDGAASDLWRVTVRADAQNKYGATLRKTYMLVYKQTGDSLGGYVLENFYALD